MVYFLGLFCFFSDVPPLRTVPFPGHSPQVWLIVCAQFPFLPCSFPLFLSDVLISFCMICDLFLTDPYLPLLFGCLGKLSPLAHSAGAWHCMLLHFCSYSYLTLWSLPTSLTPLLPWIDRCCLFGILRTMYFFGLFHSRESPNVFLSPSKFLDEQDPVSHRLCAGYKAPPGCVSFGVP